MKTAEIIIASFWIASHVSASNAGSDPEKMKITPESTEGAVLIKVPIHSTLYTLSFSKDGRSGFGSRGYSMRVEPNFRENKFKYIVMNAKPGNYRIDSIFLQKSWGACLHDHTISLQVNPGEISYVGYLDARPVLESIYRQAVAKGETKVRS